jgi:hypothetical protein
LIPDIRRPEALQAVLVLGSLRACWLCEVACYKRDAVFGTFRPFNPSA